MSGMTPDLAGRVIAGALRGSLYLTVDEVRIMLEDVHPDAVVVADHGLVRVCDVPVFVIDNIDPFPSIDPDEWNRQLVASLHDDLLDADDVDRLWKRT